MEAIGHHRVHVLRVEHAVRRSGRSTSAAADLRLEGWRLAPPADTERDCRALGVAPWRDRPGTARQRPQAAGASNCFLLREPAPAGTAPAPELAPSKYRVRAEFINRCWKCGRMQDSGGAKKNSARDSVGCPGGGKEAIQHPLSTGSCNCQASEEERLNRSAYPRWSAETAYAPARGFKLSTPPYVLQNSFGTLRESYDAGIKRLILAAGKSRFQDMDYWRGTLHHSSSDASAGSR